jgi:Fe2+ transport system protein B
MESHTDEILKSKKFTEEGIREFKTFSNEYSSLPLIESKHFAAKDRNGEIKEITSENVQGTVTKVRNKTYNYGVSQNNIRRVFGIFSFLFFRLFEWINFWISCCAGFIDNQFNSINNFTDKQQIECSL